MGGVIISPNIKKTSVRIDPDGNIINKDTKEIIENNSDLIPEPVTTPIVREQPVQHTLSIADQIKETEERLAQLKELKQLKIQQMKAEIELLESK